MAQKVRTKRKVKVYIEDGVYWSAQTHQEYRKSHYRWFPPHQAEDLLKGRCVAVQKAALDSAMWWESLDFDQQVLLINDYHNSLYEVDYTMKYRPLEPSDIEKLHRWSINSQYSFIAGKRI